VKEIMEAVKSYVSILAPGGAAIKSA
jgi:hypothetical protein